MLVSVFLICKFWIAPLRIKTQPNQLKLTWTETVQQCQLVTLAVNMIEVSGHWTWWWGQIGLWYWDIFCTIYMEHVPELQPAHSGLVCSVYCVCLCMCVGGGRWAEQQGSVLGIVTCYGLKSPGFEPWWRKDFLDPHSFLYNKYSISSQRKAARMWHWPPTSSIAGGEYG
jgi:hypothetical protein